MNKISILLVAALVIFGCQKQEAKPVIESVPEEETVAQTEKVVQPSSAITPVPLPPMAAPTPTSPKALTQYLPQPTQTETAFTTFYVYSDKNSPDNHFIPSGWMGDYSDVALIQDHMINAFSGSTCIKVTYANKASSGARWAGIYWQDPANNWGTNPSGGFNLTGAKKLTFQIKGAKGGERIEEIKMGGISGSYPDSGTAGIGPVVLTTEWKQYSFDLTGKDLSHIIGGFALSANLDANPEGCTFYLDDIRYE